MVVTLLGYFLLVSIGGGVIAELAGLGRTPGSVNGILLYLGLSVFAAPASVGLALVLQQTAATPTSIGLVRPSGRWLLAGAGTGLLGLVGFWVLAWSAQNAGAVPQLQRAFLDASQGTPAQFGLLLMLGGLLGPFGEEVLFRGVLYTWLRRWGWVLAILVSSVVFGVLHGLTPVFLLHATAMGALLALLYEKSGSLWPGVLAHGLHNALLLVLARVLL